RLFPFFTDATFTLLLFTSCSTMQMPLPGASPLRPEPLEVRAYSTHVAVPGVEPEVKVVPPRIVPVGCIAAEAVWIVSAVSLLPPLACWRYTRTLVIFQAVASAGSVGRTYWAT